MESLDNLDRKKAAILGLSALGSIIVSYLVYKSVADEESIEKQLRRDRMLRKAKQEKSQQSSKSRIVGTSQKFHSRDEPSYEE